MQRDAGRSHTMIVRCLRDAIARQGDILFPHDGARFNEIVGDGTSRAGLGASRWAATMGEDGDLGHRPLRIGQ